jgi:hypothetical protein
MQFRVPARYFEEARHLLAQVEERGRANPRADQLPDPEGSA